MALNEQISEMDKLIEGRFREHELADIILSVPGIGPLLGAEFLAAVGGGLDAFDSPDALAAFAGVAPAPRDSGKVSGNLHRPSATTADSSGSSTPPRWSASATTPTRGSSTTANAPKARSMSRPCSPSPADASTSCGP